MEQKLAGQNVKGNIGVFKRTFLKLDGVLELKMEIVFLLVAVRADQTLFARHCD